MPRLSINSAIRILILLLLDLVLPENIKYSKQNIPLLSLQEEKVAYDSYKSFWKRRLLHKNELIETNGLRSLNEISRPKSDQIAKDTNTKEDYKDVMKNVNGKTLMDYNGPTIMEDVNNRNDHDFAIHVRVKRDKPINYPIISHQWNHSINLINSFPQNFYCKTNAMNVFGDSISKFEESYADSEHKNRSNIFCTSTIDTPRSRHKRRVLSKNGQRRKRVKGSNRHLNHHIGIKTKNQKHSLKSFHKSAMKKVDSLKKRIKKAEIEMPTRKIAESQIESIIENKESRNNNLSAGNARVDTTDYEMGILINQKEDVSLIDNISSDEQQKESAVVLPFMHAEKAELRLRIEKIPTNESLFINNSNNWTNHFRTNSIMLPKYDKIDKIFNVNITNPELTTNFDSTEKETNNLQMEIKLKKLDYRNNGSSQETSDSKNALLNDAESYSVESNFPSVKDNRKLKNGKCNYVNKTSAESLNENAKSRAKRNQEITSKRYLQCNTNAMGSKHFKDARQRISIVDAKHEKTRRTRGNRAVRSIEEIKDLAEKLVIKVNELQMYVSNHNETLYLKHSCISKNADHVSVAEAPSDFLEVQNTSNLKSKIVRNIDNSQHFAKNSRKASLIGKRVSKMPSRNLRFARERNQMSKKPRRKWGRWMDWSSCSVTCGKGRQIRWRHCLRDCSIAETEMEEKACQLPACPPGKFLGIF